MRMFGHFGNFVGKNGEQEGRFQVFYRECFSFEVISYQRDCFRGNFISEPKNARPHGTTNLRLYYVHRVLL